MLNRKDAEKLNNLCAKFEKDVIEYIKNLYVEKGFVKDEIKVTLNYSPQYRYVEKELTRFQKVLKFLRFPVVDTGLHNQQAMRLYTVVVDPSPAEIVPYSCFEPGLSGLFYLNDDDDDLYPACLSFFTQDLKKKIS